MSTSLGNQSSQRAEQGRFCGCPKTGRADQPAVSAQACKEGRWKGGLSPTSRARGENPASKEAQGAIGCCASRLWMQPLSFLGSQENPVALDLAPTRGF